MLFAMEDFTSLGHHELPDDPASMEILCAWNTPKTAKVDHFLEETRRNRRTGLPPHVGYLVCVMFAPKNSRRGETLCCVVLSFVVASLEM